jgi:uncharacterized protein (UPF0335 family)
MTPLFIMLIAEIESLESKTKQLSDRISELASELEGRCQTI